jgi:hypothetical protein
MALLEQWQATGMLYSRSWEESEIDGLRTEFCDAELGYRYEDDDPLPEAVYIPSVPAARGGHGPGQRAMAMFPINLASREARKDRPAKTKSVMRCFTCQKYFATGFGCGFCLRPTCRTCLREEQHRCDRQVRIEINCYYCRYEGTSEDHKCRDGHACENGEADWICVSRRDRVQKENTLEVAADKSGRLYLQLDGGGQLPLTPENSDGLYR